MPIAHFSLIQLLSSLTSHFCHFAFRTLAKPLIKLKEKNADFIVLNSLQTPGAGFKHNTNQITILKNSGEKIAFNLKSKNDVAIDIVNEIVKITNTIDA